MKEAKCQAVNENHGSERYSSPQRKKPSTIRDRGRIDIVRERAKRSLLSNDITKKKRNEALRRMVMWVDGVVVGLVCKG